MKYSAKPSTQIFGSYEMPPSPSCGGHTAGKTVGKVGKLGKNWVILELFGPLLVEEREMWSEVRVGVAGKEGDGVVQGSVQGVSTEHACDALKVLYFIFFTPCTALVPNSELHTVLVSFHHTLVR